MIKVWDYLAEYGDHRAEILEAVEEVFRSGWLILGPKVKAFEDAFPAWCGGGIGVGVNNGTDALVLALRALGVAPGDEVITVPNTAVPTVSAIVTAGATPVFVDIVPGTYLMDVSALEAAVTPRTKCILPVHLYGQCCDMATIGAVAGSHGLTVLEDCAQSHGARWRGRRCGTLGDIAAFSFYPTKILGAYGDAGMVVTEREEVAERVRRLRKYGMTSTYYADEHGYNTRLDEVQASILLRKLGWIDEDLARRRAIAARYDEVLAGSGLALPETAADNEHAYYLYVVRHPDRDRIMAELKKADIHLNVSYPFPIHTMRGYADLGYREGQFPVAEAAAREVFSLPMYPTLTKDDQAIVIETLRKVLDP